MGFLMFALGFLLFGAGLLYGFVKKDGRLIFITLLCLGFSTIGMVLSSLTTVSAGHVGVPVVFGHVRGDYLDPGIHIVNPFASIRELSFRTESYTMSSVANEGHVKGNDSIIALSSNGLRMPMDVTVPFRLVPEAAPWVYNNIGPNYVDTILRPAARTAVRAAAAQYTDTECYSTKRDELAKEIQNQLEIRMKHILSDKHSNAPEVCFVIPDVLLRTVELPDTVKEAIERKTRGRKKEN